MFQLKFEPLTIVTWAILIAVPLLLWQFTLYVRRSAASPLRRIAAYSALRQGPDQCQHLDFRSKAAHTISMGAADYTG